MHPPCPGAFEPGNRTAPRGRQGRCRPRLAVVSNRVRPCCGYTREGVAFAGRLIGLRQLEGRSGGPLQGVKRAAAPSMPHSGRNRIVREATQWPHTQVVTKGPVQNGTGRRRGGQSHDDFVNRGSTGPERPSGGQGPSTPSEVNTRAGPLSTEDTAATPCWGDDRGRCRAALSSTLGAAGSMVGSSDPALERTLCGRRRVAGVDDHCVMFSAAIERQRRPSRLCRGLGGGFSWHWVTKGEFGRETRWLTSTATTGRGRRCDSEWWATTWRSAFSAGWSAWGHERGRAVSARLRAHATSRVTEPTSGCGARPSRTMAHHSLAEPGHGLPPTWVMPDWL
jgi:hypothetical protein